MVGEVDQEASQDARVAERVRRLSPGVGWCQGQRGRSVRFRVPLCWSVLENGWREPQQPQEARKDPQEPLSAPE